MRKNVRDKTATIKLVDWSLVKNIPNGTTLQKCLENAQDTNNLYKPMVNRVESLEFMHCQKYDGCFVGVLGVYEEGKSVEGIRVCKKTKNKEIYQTKLDEGEKLESALYFCVSGDKVAVVQSVKLKTPALQEHISKILEKCYEGFEGTIMLTDRLSDEAMKLIQNKGVEAITFGEKITDTGAEAIKIATGIFSNKVKNEWSNRLGNALKESMISGIKTRVEVELCGKDKKVESAQIIQALALGMCNDLEGVAVRLGNGKVLKEGMLLTKKLMSVTFQDGCPILTEMFKGLRSSLSSDDAE